MRRNRKRENRNKQEVLTGHRVWMLKLSLSVMTDDGRRLPHDKFNNGRHSLLHLNRNSLFSSLKIVNSTRNAKSLSFYTFPL